MAQVTRELNDPTVGDPGAGTKSFKGSSRAAERDRERQAKEAGIDKAYLREYFEPDTKRRAAEPKAVPRQGAAVELKPLPH